jgi:hypothetical protein
MHTSFAFSRYDAAELNQCAEEFSRDFRTATYATSPEWTTAVLRWFADCAAPGVGVFPPQCDRNGEFLVDLCHTTLPMADARVIDWWEQTLAGRVELLLALESEWGSVKQSGLNLRRVLDDALKLVIVRARVKAMVFSSRNRPNQQDIVKALNRLRIAAQDQSPMLWIDIPWKFGESTSERLESGVLL